ncbi:uncharacterized protein LOC123904892 [Trifolium pratense]|nr:uncharacterized protein LOC123904892 [Trifolium pratense]
MSIMMNDNFFVWNCRGAASTAFYRNCKQYVDKYKPVLIVIMETRTSPLNLRRSFELLGYDGYQYANNNGFAGGIIVSWKERLLDVEVIVNHFQFLHLKVILQNKKCFFFSPVYASPREEGRHELWRELKTISRGMVGEWLLAGDFNDIANPSEKKGGLPAQQRKCDKFVDRINDCNLIDCGATGPKFTWRGPVFQNKDRIFERLDRAFSNDEWRLGFPNAVVKVLPRVNFSDHHPLLIALYGFDHVHRPRYFKFESAWLLEESYMGMLEACWSGPVSIKERLSQLAHGIKEWNDITVERVMKQKRKLLGRIGGIQRKLQTERRNRFLIRLEKDLQDELAHILKSEELMWFQRSRANWLVDGDRNTRYYHLKAITRRRYNKVNMLRDMHGNWVEDVEALKQMANNYYKALFADEGNALNWYQTKITFPQLNDEDLQMIRGDITNEEVKRAVFNMSPWKAPGPDGFPAGFYQKSWKIVGQSVCDFVKQVWSNPLCVRDVNYTDICLIPKVDQPESIQQFRPISLCNTLYKIVSKVMTNRIKDTITTVVSPHQTGFIPGRSIHENIVVAQEMAHSMRKLNGKVGYFAIKVDLSKAYDRLNWNFIHQTLTEVGYPLEWINVVMTSVTSVRTNVKWNGVRAEYFQPQQGIRQGDPISPYLFVICMDKLSHLITQGVQEGEWKPMRAGKNGPFISHLMFADDLLLFVEATSTQMNVVLRILGQFCQLSGQQVSHEKTSIMFSKNVGHQVREELLLLSGFNVTPSLGKYLGVPLVGRAPRRSDYNYLLDQVKSKLSAWKAKQLSFAGRVTLLKSVIEAIPIYPMMTTPIPKACLNEIQKIQRAFIWGDEDGSRKYHAVSWDTVTKPKAHGGLGIRRLINMNKACLMKLGWALRTGQQALWIDVVKGKYVRQNSSIEDPIVRAQDSTLWKSLSTALHNFHMYEFWTIGDGATVNAWSDHWLLYGRPIKDLGIVIPHELHGWKVKDLVDNNGVWKVDDLSTWLPQNIINRLFAIVPPKNVAAADRLAWRGTTDGKFSIASAYTMLCNFNDDEWDVVWRRVWRLQVPERVRSFIWLVKHDRLLTNYRKSKMNVCTPWCKHCVDIVEDTMHVLRDCPLAKVIWCNLMNGLAGATFYAANLHDWITMNLQQDLGRVKAGIWSCVWAVGCHFLWLWRNREAHGDERVRPSQPWRVIMNWVHHYKRANVSQIASHITTKEVVQIGWNGPEGDWIMLNTDGASRCGSTAGCGGLLRNSGGQWLGGFSHHLGRCNAYIAELWGVFDGLTFAYDRGFKKIALHIDSNVVVHTLQSDKDGSVVGWRIIQEIRRLLGMDWEVKICHSYRESNACVDALANLGCDHEPGMRVYEQCPMSLSSLLLADVMGITTPRVISL